MKAEQNCVEPIAMKLLRRLVTFAKLIVDLIVVFSVYRLIVIIPSASKITAIVTSSPRESLRLTYAIPMMLESARVPMQNPVIIAKIKLP